MLRETLCPLIENAFSAAKSRHDKAVRQGAMAGDPPRVKIDILARAEPSRSPNFRESIALEISNSGPPINPEDVDNLFIDGYTIDSRVPPGGPAAREMRHRGR